MAETVGWHGGSRRTRMHPGDVRAPSEQMWNVFAGPAVVSTGPLRLEQHRRLAAEPDPRIRHRWASRCDQPEPLARQVARTDPHTPVRATLLSSPSVDARFAFERRHSTGWATLMHWGLRPDADDVAAAAAVVSLPERHRVKLLEALSVAVNRGIGPGQRPATKAAVAVAVSCPPGRVWDTATWPGWYQHWCDLDDGVGYHDPHGEGDLSQSPEHLASWHYATYWDRKKAIDTLGELYATDTGDVLSGLMHTTHLSMLEVASAVQRLAPHPVLADRLAAARAVDVDAYQREFELEPF
jgi:hypothetical protein